ncbi:MAG: divalent-cation tolerance protein CutA [Dehalococcoidia bacterium]|nr:divalent-cation tolerance protein CutA [Dehalococcoidia bacterium]
MRQAKAAVILVTVTGKTEADKIAAVLLESRKAACVNIIPGVSSQFWWQGKIDDAEEMLLLIKTRLSVVREVVDLVKKNHSYTVPEVIALPVIDGNQDYLSWIDGEVRE